MGPGQRFATAAMEVCGRVTARDNEVTISWVPAHSGVQETKRRMLWPRRRQARRPRAATRSQTSYGGGTSLPHMTRSATEARSRASAEWISSHVGAERRYSPSPEEASAARAYAAQELAGRHY